MVMHVWLRMLAVRKMPIAEAELRNALKVSLPDYMIPTLIMVLPSLPLNPNGKIDRAALPKPQVIQRCTHLST